MWPSKRSGFIRNVHTTKEKVSAEFAHRKDSATINATNTNAKSALRIYFAGMVGIG